MTAGVLDMTAGEGPVAGKVAVVGTGSWGTAAAGLVAANAEAVCLVARGPEVAESICARHRNPRHLTGYVLPDNVTATTEAARALDGADAVVFATPSAFLRATAHRLAPLVGEGVPALVLTKGIEPGTHALMSEVVAQELGGASPVAALTGPNHAEEISQGQVSASVAAAEDEGLALSFQRLFMGPHFRVYTSSDLRGVEVCGAVKNVIAIACGISVGIGNGDNALAVLMTRGLAEMSRVVSSLGGDPMTCMGLAGMGDLVATCTSQHSRNRTFGEAFTRGESLDAYEARTHMVVEGARAVESTLELAQERGIEVPITRAVHGVLFGGATIEEVMGCLLGRSPKPEFYGL